MVVPAIPCIKVLDGYDVCELSMNLHKSASSYLGTVCLLVETLDFNGLTKLISDVVGKRDIYVDLSKLNFIGSGPVCCCVSYADKQLPGCNKSLSTEELSKCIVRFLNCGAACLILTTDQFDSFKDNSPDYVVPNVLHRIALRVNANCNNDEQYLKSTFGRVFCADHNDYGQEFRGELVSSVATFAEWNTKIIISYAEFDEKCAPERDLEELVNAGCYVLVPERWLVVGGDNNLLSLHVNIEKCLLASLVFSRIQSDRADSLVPTVVVDEHLTCLGLVYSNKESFLTSLVMGRGVYQSRKHGLWIKGESSGDIQELIRIDVDCDSDCLRYTVRQKGRGFCHTGTYTCFGTTQGLAKLEKTLIKRLINMPDLNYSYTKKLLTDDVMLRAKILEEAEELCEAKNYDDIAFEAADLLYFMLTYCVKHGVLLNEVERQLTKKSLLVQRRAGLPKEKYLRREKQLVSSNSPAHPHNPDWINVLNVDMDTVMKAIERPSVMASKDVLANVQAILDNVKKRGDSALKEYTKQFDKVDVNSVMIQAPFPKNMMEISKTVKDAIDLAFDNIRKFHAAQANTKSLNVETMPGVNCWRLERPIERVGLYVPGGSAVLPSTALMLGVPAMVAGCPEIIISSPPDSSGSISKEIVYIADRIGASGILVSGGSQAIGALAYGTQSVKKVDKIFGPGNQYVTAAKMLVSNDINAKVAIDMPSGPSEVLIVADNTCCIEYIVADLLSQAEHGPDSQSILIAVNFGASMIAHFDREITAQIDSLPRKSIVDKAMLHSRCLNVDTLDLAVYLTNLYAPEHLILHVEKPKELLSSFYNFGSAFLGRWTPESVGDYAAGVNHSLPTYGYSKQTSGVNLSSFMRYPTCTHLTQQGLKLISPAVKELAKLENLEAHRRAVEIRL